MVKPLKLAYFEPLPGAGSLATHAQMAPKGSKYALLGGATYGFTPLYTFARARDRD